MFKQELKLTKGQRKKFYSRIWEYYDLFFSTFSDRSLLNPNHDNELGILFQAWQLCSLPLPEHDLQRRFMEEVYQKHWDRFHRMYAEKAKANGGWPKPNKTETILIAIDRGFVHEDDIEDDSFKYKLYLYIGDLVWPWSFEEQKEAIDVQNRYGIHGYTGITTPN